MGELLEAASPGKLSANRPSGIGLPEEATAVAVPPVGNGEVLCSSFLCLVFLRVRRLHLSFAPV